MQSAGHIHHRTEKRDSTVKGRMVYNRKLTRAWHEKEDSASPTAKNEAILLTAAINAKERCDVMTENVPNACRPTCQR